MQSRTDTQLVRRDIIGRIDARSVFRLYALLACVTGVSVVGTGVRGIPGLPLSHASLIWITGAAIVFAGCSAWGLALIEDPVKGRRALHRFAAGHVIFGLMLWMQWGVYWGGQGLPQWVALEPIVIGVGLSIIAFLVHGGGLGSQSQRRSSYEEHIRQVARREERARLARDLHDAVKQQLFVIQTAAATAQTRLDHDRDGSRTALDQARAAAREATTEMEALLEELQAAPLENTGLVEALKKQCQALGFRTGAVVTFEPGELPSQGRLPAGAHEAVYRVAQEALANIARHARASHVTVSLSTSGTQFQLRVADNGSGFDTRDVHRGMGMANMEARAAELDGHVSVESGPSGTNVLLEMPLIHHGVRAAWVALGLTGIMALNLAVFYGIRGGLPERPVVLLFELLAAWALWQIIATYRRQSRERARRT